MFNPESAVQLNLSQAGEKRLSFSELTILGETITNGCPYSVVFFEGRKGIDACSQELKKLLEEKDFEVRVIHYQQLLFQDNQSLGQPFVEYSESPLVVKPLKPCLTMVAYFEDLNEERMKEVLGRINKAQNLTSWILLVPRWREIRPNLALDDWAFSHQVRRFFLNV